MAEVDEQTTLPDEGSEGREQGELQLELEVVHPKLPEGRAVLTQDTPVLVGRDSGTATLRVRDVKLSRSHFRIFWDRYLGAYRVQDMQSRNGTYLNGQPVSTAPPLQDGDVIRAGDSLAVFHKREPAVDLDQRTNLAQSAIAVLIQGETGTGKERLASELHALSGREPFVAVNCGAVAPELIASELFGHVRGAFSGASSQRRGLFVAASGGTLFLDEVGELPSELQPTLLRVLEGGAVRPVGAEREVPVDVRIISATNADLEAAMQQGRFRRDLYARLAGFTIFTTPLRRKRHRILEIARAISSETGRSLSFGADGAEALLLWEWPYNVRELKALLRAHWALTGGEEPLRLENVRRVQPEIVSHFQSQRRSPVAAGVTEQVGLSELLAQHGGNVSAVAKRTGRSRGAIYRWMQRAGVKPVR